MTLVELLIATSVAVVVLGASWAWLWNVGRFVSAADDRAQVSTAAEFAARSLAADIEAAAGLAVPPAAYSPERALVLVHRHARGGPDTVLLVWDPARRVLWRKTSATYLAENVREMDLSYFDPSGRLLGAEDLSQPGWTGRVASVSVRLVIACGRASVRLEREMVVGQG